MSTMNGEGEAPRSSWQRPDAPLGTLIFREGLLSAEQLEDALGESVKRGKRLGQVLVERGLLEEAQVARILARQKGLDYVDLRETPVDPAAASLLTSETAWLTHAVPIAVVDGTPVVAVEDPGDEEALRKVGEALGTQPRFAVATRSEILRVLGSVFDGGTSGAVPAPAQPVVAAAPLQPSSEPQPVATVQEPAPAPQPVVAEASGLRVAAPAPEPAAEAAPEPPAEVVPEPPAPVAAELPPEPVVEQPPVVQAAPEPEPAPVVQAAPPPPEPAPAPAPVAVEPAPEPPAPVAAEPAPLAAEPPVVQAVPAPTPEPPVAPTPVAETPPAPPEEQQPAPEPPPLEVVPAPTPEPEPEPEPPPAAETPLALHVATSETGEFRVVARLSDGVEIEVDVFASLEEAKGAAKLLTRQIGTAAPGEWPQLGGRFVRPDLIVSVDVPG